MPKIEVNEALFFNLLGAKYDYDSLEEKLTCAKAELDEKPDPSLAEAERSIKIELNDTNRPDLWSTAGIARQLRMHNGLAKSADYSSFLSTEKKNLPTNEGLKNKTDRFIKVDPALKDIRPFMTAFLISGKPIDEHMLVDIIQTQEKLCWNYGRKRRSIAMGVYRSQLIEWPVQYKACDPDKRRFIPLASESEMSLREINKEHPKGKDFGWIIENEKLFPLIVDAKDEVLSMPPVINSAKLGAVEVGDSDLMVEMTGTDMDSLLLATNIVACDFFDAGYTILPVRVEHPYETGYGKTITTPFYFQKTTQARLSAINTLLGHNLTKDEVQEALTKMDCHVSIEEKEGESLFTLTPPAYRNDFLHEVDIIEDVAIGKKLSFFTPEKPHDFTIGRLLPLTLFSRKAKSLMVGLGYQEMIFNYLGSKRDYIDRMNISADSVIEVANPMSENYQFVRPSIIPSLLAAEAVSANAVYPHNIFEIGKVAFLCDEENTGTRTRQNLGFVSLSQDANFNTGASEVATLLYFLGHEYKVKESDDPRFIKGRQALVFKGETEVGIFGEIHPQVLENWDIGVPCFACELDLEELI